MKFLAIVALAFAAVLTGCGPDPAYEEQQARRGDTYQSIHHEDSKVRVIALPVDGEQNTDYDGWLIEFKETDQVYIMSGAPSVGVRMLTPQGPVPSQLPDGVRLELKR